MECESRPGLGVFGLRHSHLRPKAQVSKPVEALAAIQAEHRDVVGSASRPATCRMLVMGKRMGVPYSFCRSAEHVTWLFNNYAITYHLSPAKLGKLMVARLIYESLLVICTAPS